MDTYISHYHVGPHFFRVTSDSALVETPASFHPFLMPERPEEEPLFQLHVELGAGRTDAADGDTITGEDASGNEEREGDVGFDWENARCFIRFLGDGHHRIYIRPHSTEQTFCVICCDNFACNTLCLCNLVPDTRRGVGAFVLNNSLMLLYAFRAAKHGTLLIHASVVTCQGKGYLFLGKSGTGKSTHSRLWLEHVPGSRLLNDDNPIVHVNPDGQDATVYGSPWSGKTPCYFQASAPIGAFISLEQAPRNEITRKDIPRAFAALLPSCSCLKQEKTVYGGVLAAVGRLVTAVPVFHLKCLPDKAAAELCRKTMDKLNLMREQKAGA
ncbi:hypothetical protein EII33_01490 [Bacteroides heparinolyticus]|uniref:Phosphoenolpyruvate carboxykinase n=1 Tax=Prevotella heparinolytica TaxID=28113 RepID=A0A3P2AC42_9BACE|nr:hypothetical protein [Bacteroides heparinolyticus]RRD93102.1 hypothetical protein EII33_01490 [Bacteroides heparinolyticus]